MEVSGGAPGVSSVWKLSLRSEIMPQPDSEGKAWIESIRKSVYHASYDEQNVVTGKVRKGFCCITLNLEEGRDRKKERGQRQ